MVQIWRLKQILPCVFTLIVLFFPGLPGSPKCGIKSTFLVDCLVCSAHAQMPEDASIAAVEWVTTPLVMEAMGTIQAKHKMVIAGKHTARVEKVHVSAGQKVQSGDLLVELDQRDLLARKAAAVAAQQAAQADLSLAVKEYERTNTLFEKSTTSQRTLDMAKTNRDASLAKLAQAKQEVLVVDAFLDYTKIHAPVSGTIVERAVEPGDLAVPGKELLTMYDPRELRLEAMVPESLLPHIFLGKDLTVVIDTPNLEVTGKVEEIVPQAYTATRSFTVKVALPHIDRVYPGMFGRLRIPSGEKKRLLVPLDAVRTIGQVEIIEMVTGEDSYNRLQITTGKRFNKKIEILSGLNPPQNGQEIIKVLIRKKVER